MSAANTTKWIGIGLLGLPLYGVLAFGSSLDPQPDLNTATTGHALICVSGYLVDLPAKPT